MDDVEKYRVEQLEKDMAEVKGKIAEFANHVASCEAVKKEQIRWIKAGIIIGAALLGVGSHDEAMQLLGGL